MVKSSKGLRRRTRSKLSKRPRERGLSPITRSFQTYTTGEKASIVIDSSVHKGQPHSRFHGKTGTVVGTQGNALLLDVKMGNKMKRVIVKPEHLKKQKF